MQVERIGAQVSGEVGACEGASVIRVTQSVAACAEVCAGGLEARRIGRELAELRNRNGVLARPIRLETLCRLLRDGTADEDVHVLKVQLAAAEILVANVAPAEHHGRVIGDELLVVQAPVDSREAGQQLAQPVYPRSVDIGIEDTDVDVLVRIQSGHDVVFLVQRAPVIEQDADSYAAISGGDESIDDQRPGLVGVEDVVLQIQRAVGELDQDGACHEGVEAGGQEPEPGPASVLLASWVDPAFKTGHVPGR